MDEAKKALALAEYGPLREEVNRTIDRMTNNELACGGFIFAVIFASFTISSKDHQSIIPCINILSSFLCIIVALAGETRSSVFRRHMDQVDQYLANIERQFGDDVGWTNHYRKTMAKCDDARQIGTRKLLWHILKFVACLNVAFQIALAFLPSGT